MSPLAKEQGIPAHRQLNLVCIMHLTALSQVLTASPAHWRPSQLATWRLPSLRQFVDGRTITQSCPSAGNSEQRHPAARQQQPCALAASSGYPEGSPGQQVQRALGLDYGRRVVGLAVSTLGLAPRPLDGVPGCASAADVLATAQAVLEVAMRERCDAIVVGLPVTSTGSLRRRDTDSQQGRRCRNFASTLASLAEPRGLRVFLADERGSTLEARQVLEASGSRRSTFSRVRQSLRVPCSTAVLPRTAFPARATVSHDAVAAAVLCLQYTVGYKRRRCLGTPPPSTHSRPAAAQGQRVCRGHPDHLL